MMKFDRLDLSMTDMIRDSNLGGMVGCVGDTFSVLGSSLNE